MQSGKNRFPSIETAFKLITMKMLFSTIDNQKGIDLYRQE